MKRVQSCNCPGDETALLLSRCTTSLLKAVDKEMGGVAAEQRQRLETLDAEWRRSIGGDQAEAGPRRHFIETSDIEMADASERIKEH